MTEKEILQLAREQYAEAVEGMAQAREEFEEDVRIFDGQGIWPERLRAAREGDPKGARPCLNISDLAPRVHQVTNDFRQNTPAMKIRPVDDKADPETAKIFNGLARHCEQRSDADMAYENANFYQTVGGEGWFRMVEEYCEGARELAIRPVFNTRSVKPDPFALDPVGIGMRYCFIDEDVPRAVFEREYPGVEACGWDGDDVYGWVTDDTVKVCEYMHIETSKKNKIKTRDGDLYEDDYWAKAKKDGAAPEVMGNYEEKNTRVVWRKLIAGKILKELDLPITFIPMFRMAGESYMKDGRPVMKGLVRDSRDSVRMVSYMFSTYVEATALQPKAPFVGAAGAFDGFENEWAGANSDNLAYLEYNTVDVNGNPAPPPQRSQPPMASQGIMQGLMLAKDALKDTSGLGAASLGQKGNETSGKAILARQKEGDVSTFHIPDNAAKAIRHCGRVFVQWAPKVYDEPMVARIIGEDGAADKAHLDPTQKESMRKVQQADGSIRRIYNLGVGKYDVVASVGPSYTTKRVEQAEMMNQLFQSFPAAFQVLGDIFMENQDGPGTDRMAKRLKAMLPPQAAQADGDDDQQAIPPQVQAKLQQMEQQLNEGKSIVTELMQENDQLKAEQQAKDAEIRAKIYAENEATRRTKIQSLASVTVAEMNNDTKELIAGLQHALSQAQMVNDQQNQFIEKMMQVQQTEHSQALDIANTQHSQGMDLRNADNAEQQQQFSQQQAMEQQAMEQQALAAQQAQETPPAGG
jgi:hypothetical protein